MTTNVMCKQPFATVISTPSLYGIVNKWNELPKVRFTRYDFVACDKLTTGLRHELFRVNQTYNSLTTVVYVTKNVVGF